MQTTLGLFIFIAGFIIGLGAVTVIDILGFLGIKSNYCTETTIRVHKVTKPLIWIGIILATFGAYIFYKSIGVGFSFPVIFHFIALTILIINGSFLSFYISPKLLQREKEGLATKLLPWKIQIPIAFSFIISFISWWSSLFLLIWFIIFIL